MIIREADCGTEEFVELPIHVPEGLNKSVMGRILAEDVHKPLASGKPGKTVVAEKGEPITLPACARSRTRSRTRPPSCRSARC